MLNRRKRLKKSQKETQEIHNPNEARIRDHAAERNIFLRRILIAFVFVILMIAILLFNLINLQVVNYKFYSTVSNNNRIELIIIPPQRGVIFDRNGIPIAKNESIYQLNIVPDKDKIPPHFENLEDELNQLKQIIHLQDEEIKNFQDSRKNYAMYREIPLKTNLSLDDVYQFTARQHLYPNVTISVIQHRSYPYKEALSHVVGYMSKISDKDREQLIANDMLSNYSGTNDIGKSGIEKFYEDVLHGSIGYRRVEIDSRRRIIRELEKEKPESGKDIYLTIDLNLQLFIYDILKDRRAAVVAINPNNGEVLALVSTPSFDPNLFVGGISSANYSGLRDNPDKPLYNRATLGGYSPASTVKPFMAISALTEKVITPKTVMNHPGYWQLPNSTRKFRDWRRWGHGRVDITKSLEESVDTFYYQVAFDLGIDRIYQWMNLFSFGTRTGIDLSDGEVSTANLPNREWKKRRYKQNWMPGDTVNIGIGQGYWTATPLQLAKALTILVNEGKTYTPHLLLKTSETSTPQPAALYLEKNPQLESVNPAYWQIVKNGMYQVLYGSTGTARRVFANSGYKAAGKSGTAQVYSLKQDERYDASKIAEHLRDNALFMAYAPYESPEIALAIVLENGGGGSSQGGAVARQILDYYLLGIDPRETEEESQE